MNRDIELRRLVELARVLVARGVHVGMSDARPALTVRAAPGDAPLYVTADDGAFGWLDVSHSAADPAGAAERIAALVRVRASRKP